MRTLLLLLALPWFFLPGCGVDSSSEEYVSEARLSKGLVIILPGIEGESEFNHDIRYGLVQAGVPGALPIYNWGRPIPVAGPLLNEMDVIGNRLEGRKIAQMVVDYQDGHPGKPVYIVGHSGGGGVAVFAAESLPDGRKLDGLVLLSASISCDYDMTKALAHCKCGIVNFYSPADVGLLVIATTLAGNVDGTHGPGAGQKGIQGTYDRVWQEEVPTDGDDAHFAATRSGYVSSTVARWVLSDRWPVR